MKIIKNPTTFEDLRQGDFLFYHNKNNNYRYYFFVLKKNNKNIESFYISLTGNFKLKLLYVKENIDRENFDNQRWIYPYLKYKEEAKHRIFSDIFIKK